MLHLRFPDNLSLGYSPLQTHFIHVCITHVRAKEAHMETNDTFTHLQISVFVGPNTLPGSLPETQLSQLFPYH